MLPKMGWKRDLPNIKDFTMESEQIKPLLKGLNKPISKDVDLRKGFSPVEDQGNIGSCTSQAAAALLEYFELNSQGKYIDASRLFLYYGARILGGYFPGDNGAEIRNAMGALVLFGSPPEKFWPYKEELVNSVPDPVCFALAQSYQAVKYYRLDTPKKTRQDVLNDIKLHLSNSIPVMFGFTCYSSLDRPEVAKTGAIPYPSVKEKMEGGHAIVAAGFSDDKIIVNPFSGKKTIGALLIRNSWGTNWGQELKGYGWLPYQYVLDGLAVDFWVMLSSEWVDIDLFS